MRKNIRKNIQLGKQHTENSRSITEPTSNEDCKRNMPWRNEKTPENDRKRSPWRPHVDGYGYHRDSHDAQQPDLSNTEPSWRPTWGSVKTTRAWSSEDEDENEIHCSMCTQMAINVKDLEEKVTKLESKIVEMTSQITGETQLAVNDIETALVNKADVNVANELSELCTSMETKLERHAAQLDDQANELIRLNGTLESIIKLLNSKSTPEKPERKRHYEVQGRKAHIIIYNIDESNRRDDSSLVRMFINNVLKLNIPLLRSITRLGDYKDGHTRPIRVIFQNVEDTRSCVNKYKQIKKMGKSLEGIKIAPNFTREEMALNKTAVRSSTYRDTRGSRSAPSINKEELYMNIDNRYRMKNILRGTESITGIIQMC